MTAEYFHGSPIQICDTLPKGTYVTRSKPYALFYAIRSGKPECYIYRMLLDTTLDIERLEDAAGTVDFVLVTDTVFVERIPVTDELSAECKAAEKAEVAKFLN